MKILFLAVLFATCEGQLTTKHGSVPGGSSCFIDKSMHEELEILKKQLLLTNDKLEAMESTHQSQHVNIDTKFEDVEKKLNTVDTKLEEVDDKLTIVDNKVEDVKDNLTTVDSILDNVDTDLGEVKIQLAQMTENSVNAKLEDVDSKFSAVDTRLGDVDERLNAVDTKLGHIDEKLTAVENNVDGIDTDIVVVKTQLEQVTEEKETRAASAFFAEGVQHGYEDSAYQSGDRMVYVNILLNPGGQYNNNTGEYSCEKTGVYYFTYSIYGFQIEDGESTSRASVTLMKEHVVQGRVFVSNHNTEPIYITLSQSLVLQCNAGEKVWVESSTNNNYIYGYPERNVFAGFLLSMN